MAVRSAAPAISLPRIDRRYVLAGLLAALAGILVLVVTQPSERSPILVATRDLAEGHRLGNGDVAVRYVQNPDGHVEGDALGDLAGFALAVPLRAGEPLIASVVRAPAIVEASHRISVAVPIDRAALGRISPGSRVDVYATMRDPIVGVATERIAGGVYVVDTELSESSGIREEIALLLAVDDDLAALIANASHAGDLDIVAVDG